MAPALVAAALVVAFPGIRGPAAERPGPDLEGSVRSIERLPWEDVWSEIHRLRDAFPRDDLEPYRALSGKLADLPQKSRFAAAALVLLVVPSSESDLRIEAQAALRQLAQGASDTALRCSAIGVLARQGYPQSFSNYAHIKRLGDAADDPDVKVACALALWRLNNDTNEVIPLFELLDHPSFGARAEAALALAETGHVDDEVRSLLRRLRDEPGERGRRAQLLLELSARNGGWFDSYRRQLEHDFGALQQRIEELSSGPRPANALAEMAGFLAEHYVNPARIHESEKELYIEAMRALVRSLDEHAEFLAPDETGAGDPEAMGQYLGLGARFLKLERGGPLIVAKPIYGGPAYRPEISYEDRLLTGDRILEIDGIATDGLDLEEIRRLLAGKRAGELVLLRVQRDGEEPRNLRIRYGTVEVPTQFHELFPDGIGYMKLHYFGPETASEFAQGIRYLEEQSGGLQGLILDLRDNPGGLLEQAVRVVDSFVGADEKRPIVSERRLDGSPGEDHLPTAKKTVGCPVVLLVNRFTASAAEVAAGALQGYGRAVVVGQRTFGKGVSQEIIDVPPAVASLVGGPAKVRIPTHYLEVPPGRRFHRERDADGRPLPEREGGIQPDRFVSEVEDAFEDWKLEDFRRVEFSPELSAYVRERFDAIRDLPIARRWDPREYEEFAELYDTLRRRYEIHLSEDEVLLALRALFRSRLADLEGRERPRDPREDRQLRAALEELLARIGKDPAESPHYSRWLRN